VVGSEHHRSDPFCTAGFRIVIGQLTNNSTVQLNGGRLVDRKLIIEPNSSSTPHAAPYPYFAESSTLFISPAGSASGSVKRTACTLTPHFHAFSLLSAALCVRARLLAGPRCHRLHAEWDGECCWKRRRIRRGERICWPRVLGIRRGSLLELVSEIMTIIIIHRLAVCIYTTPKSYTSYGFLTSYSFYNKP
jgi:hypothetical protein